MGHMQRVVVKPRALVHRTSLPHPLARRAPGMRKGLSRIYVGLVSLCLSPRMSRAGAYYRQDGVRITHDPYAEGMSDKSELQGKPITRASIHMRTPLAPVFMEETSNAIRRPARSSSEGSTKTTTPVLVPSTRARDTLRCPRR